MSEPKTPRMDKLARTPVMPTTEKGYLAALKRWATLSRSIEAELSRYLKAEKALPEESRMVGRVRMLEDKKQGEQACLDYIDKLRAHAAAVTAERDAVLEAL